MSHFGAIEAEADEQEEKVLLSEVRRPLPR